MNRLAYPSMLAMSLTLAACGGGGGDGDIASAVNSALPQLTQGAQTLAANGAADTGGSSDAGAASQYPNPSATQATSSANSGRTQTPSSSSTTANSTTTTIKPQAAAAVTIDQVIADMKSPSEAMVIDPRYSWQYNPAITMYSPAGKYIPSWWTGNRPEWSYNVLTWFTAFEAQGNAATNTRVQIRNLRFFVLSQSSRTWKQFDLKAAPGVDMWKYPFTYAGGSSGVRNEASGGISVKPKYPNFHHGYGNGVTIAPQDVRAVFVAMDYRLAVDDPSKPDDRAGAKYVVDTGGDYWPGNGQGDWSLGYAPGMGNGRMVLATPDWRTATMLIPNTAVGSSFDELKINPPPLN